MKSVKRIFRESERLQPTPELWQRIESQVKLEGKSGEASRDWSRPVFKLAASITLAVGLIGLGWYLQHRPIAGATIGTLADSTSINEAAVDMVDRELMVWDADLGEMELEADYSAEEVL